MHFNVAGVKSGDYFSILFNNELDFYKEMLTVYASGDGFVQDINIEKAKTANSDGSYNKVYEDDRNSDFKSTVNMAGERFNFIT